MAHGTVINLSRIVRWATLPEPHLRGRWLFLRVTAACFFAGFLALHDQILGLSGSLGLSPLGPRWPRLLTLLGAQGVDRLLIAQAAVGLALAALAFLDVAPKATLAGSTVLWSLCLHELGPFDVYQPDAMLVSAGFCAAVMAPRGWRPGLAPAEPPTRIEVLAVSMLLLDIYWGCAFGKMQNPAWRSLRAMDHYYESAPVPAWTGWFVQTYLPGPAVHALCGAVMAIELVAPLLLFGGRRSRRVFVCLNLALQLGIAATASHSFLNLMMIGLGLVALHDGAPAGAPQATAPRRALLRGALPAAFVAATIAAMLPRLVPASLDPFQLRVPASGPGHLVNTYGLYEDVGRAGYRIEIQGSDDGEHWRGYRSRCLPAENDERPRLVWPYQCRLDWLLWRASKRGVVTDEALLRAVVWGLARESAQVSSLFDEGASRPPPRRFRVLLSELRFATPEERDRGAWWETRLVAARGMTPPAVAALGPSRAP